MLVSIVGSVLAVFIPAFTRHLHASRLVEPLDGLQAIGASATFLASQRPASEAYPTSVGLTPEQVPSGTSVEDPPGTWDHPTWQELGFRIERPHHFSFAFDSATVAGGSKFTARSHGDLDGDGLFSTFEVSGEFLPGKTPLLYPLEMDREVE